MKVPLTSSRRAFSMIELLVVIAIMAILAVVSLPALKSTNSAAQLGGASQQLSDQLKLAGQMARTRNIPVEVRFYKVADPNNKTTSIYRAYQTFYVNDDSTYTATGKASFLPVGLEIISSSSYSTLISAMSSNMGSASTGSLPTIGTSYTYVRFQFRPDGSLTFPDCADTTAISAWTLTLQPQKGPDSTSSPGLKQNYAVITVDSVIGTVRLTRP
jgi:uncharacterized protein (TIGR02596 family)